MPQTRMKPAFSASLLGAACVVAILAAMRVAEALLVPVVLAWFFAVLALPLVRALERRRVPLSLAVLAALAVAFAVLAGFSLLLLGSLSELVEVGPRYVTEIRERLGYTLDWWSAKGIVVGAWLPERWIEPKAIVDLVSGTLRHVAGFLSQGTLVLLTMIFILLEADGFRSRLVRAFGEHPRIDRLSGVAGELQSYLGIKTLMSAILGVTVGLWVAWMGLDFPVLLGLLAFACHFIPNVGALIAAIPAMLIAFVQHDPLRAMLVAAGYVVLGLVIGNLAEPVALGRRLGLSSLAVFLSLVFWGWMWGAAGMLLSVPLTLTVKIVAEGDEQIGWLACLLDAGEPALGDEASAVAGPPPADGEREPLAGP